MVLRLGYPLIYVLCYGLRFWIELLACNCIADRVLVLGLMLIYSC